MKYLCQPHILVKKSLSPHIIPKTKGLEESLPINSLATVQSGNTLAYHL